MPHATGKELTITNYEKLRQRHCADAMALAPILVERLTWPKERLSAHRTVQLRRLLRIAISGSPWHRRRLSQLDLETFDERTLSELPTMTKDDLMEHFDEIVTDRRLSLDLVESHIGNLSGDGYLLDHYQAVASSGSSGRRGVFVFGWEAWTVRWLSNVRSVLRRYASSESESPVVFAKVAAGDPTHGTSALGRTFSQAQFPVRSFPVTQPLPEIVAGLNAAQPDVLIGYPSSLHPLVHEARAGRLRIRPRCVLSTSEPLLPEVRRGVEDTWGVAVTNCWSASETGGMATSCEAGPGMHLSDDLVVVEPVDAGGGEASAGNPSAKIYVTNLYNPTLPLIRYEITDQVTVLEGACGCGSAQPSNR